MRSSSPTRSLPTTDCSVPGLRIGTLTLPPLASEYRFSRSIQEPGRASRRLHAGCRSGRIRTSPELIPEEGAPRFRHRLIRFRHFIGGSCARISQPCPPESGPGIFPNAHYHLFDDSALRWLEINNLIADRCITMDQRKRDRRRTHGPDSGRRSVGRLRRRPAGAY
jgi:hypothetical protein